MSSTHSTTESRYSQIQLVGNIKKHKIEEIWQSEKVVTAFSWKDGSNAQNIQTIKHIKCLR